MALSDHLREKDWTFAATSQAAQRRREIALYVLIGSLGMFFTAALIGYLIIRLQVRTDLPPVTLPPILWLSTVFAIVGSSFLWRALSAVRRERQRPFRRYLVAAFVLATGFCLSQSAGLTNVLQSHFAAQEAYHATATEIARPSPPQPDVVVPPLAQPRDPVTGRPLNIPNPQSTPSEGAPATSRVQLDGLLFALILLHGLHFVAGMMALTIVTLRGLAGRYDHEYHGGVKLCAVYWRFLDVVWVVLFGAFLLAG